MYYPTISHVLLTPLLPRSFFFFHHTSTTEIYTLSLHDALPIFERCDLRHREIERFVWLIAVDPPGDAAAWQKKLSAAVDPKHGAFAVGRASPEEEEAVRSGKIVLQR